MYKMKQFCCTKLPHLFVILNYVQTECTAVGYYCVQRNSAEKIHLTDQISRHFIMIIIFYDCIGYKV